MHFENLRCKVYYTVGSSQACIGSVYTALFLREAHRSAEGNAPRAGNPGERATPGEEARVIFGTINQKVVKKYAEKLEFSELWSGCKLP